MSLKKRILIQTLSASLAFIVLLSLMFFLSVAGIRRTVLVHSEELGDSAASISSNALEEEVTDKIVRVATDLALLLDEKFIKVENYTRTIADITGAIYTHKENYRPHPLYLVSPGQIVQGEPYIYTAPGVDPARIREETDLAGNIGEMLRQITVVDRGISTSTIGGEAGYIIAMDAFPWPSEVLEPRLIDWYTGAKAKQDLYWTGVYADHRGRGPVISCSMPFYERSGGRTIFRGVARSMVRLSDISKLIDSARVGRTGYIFLLDGAGLKLFSTGNADVRIGSGGSIEGTNYLTHIDGRIRSLGLSMTLGATGMTELEIDGIPLYVSYAPIPALGWSLGVAIPVQEIFAPAWLIRERILSLTGDTMTDIKRNILVFAAVIAGILFAGLLAIAWLSVKFTQAITRPILALNEGVRELSEGHLDGEVRIKTGDELEQLAGSFNAMIVRLRQHIEEISRVTAEKERIATELDVATQIQTSMLPGNFPPFPHRKNEFDLFATVHPAKEVGGDFYDFFFIDEDHFAVIAADVSGKGIPAALFMAITETMLKNHLQTGEPPERAMDNINRQLCKNNIAEMFVTLWLGILEISSGRLDYINAGHNPPLLKSGGKGFTFLVSKPDLFLAGMEDTHYHREQTFLAGGDTLFLYTDGITEAEDTHEGFYGKERLRSFLDAHADLPLRRLLSALHADIASFSNGAEQSDDITMLALRITGEEAESERRLTLEADCGRLEELLRFIREELEKAACPPKAREQIELAAEEVFVNIARYAYDSSRGKAVVACKTEKNGERTTLSLSFTDSGRPFNPLEYPEPDITLPLEERPLGGFGILIVKRSMDTMEYSYDGGMNRLIIKKSWEGADPAGSTEHKEVL